MRRLLSNGYKVLRSIGTGRRGQIASSIPAARLASSLRMSRKSCRKSFVRETTDTTPWAYSNVVPLLIEAIKEQQVVIDSQNDRISALEARMRP